MEIHITEVTVLTKYSKIIKLNTFSGFSQEPPLQARYILMHVDVNSYGIVKFQKLLKRRGHLICIFLIENPQL